MDMKRKLVHKAARAGRLDVLMECAKRVDYTGFTLDEPTIVTDIAWFAQHSAAQSSWDVKETHQQLERVEALALLLEDERHAGDFKIAERDPRVRPELIGIMLQLSSVLAEMQNRRRDRDGRVLKYASRLRAVMEEGHQILVDGESKFGTDHYFLYRVSPIIHGLKLAQKVLDRKGALSNWCKEQEKVLADAAEESHKNITTKIGDGDRALRSLHCYELLLGERNPTLH